MITKTRSALAVAALAMAGAGPAFANFSYTNMTDITGLSLVGSAVQSGSVITMTQAAKQNVGAVWHNDKQNIALGFDATIMVRCPQTNGTGADGFALVIQNSAATPLGGFGGGIGYGTNAFFSGQTGIANSIAIEIDTYNNNDGAGWPDLPGTHISVQSRGLLPNSPEQAYSLGSAGTTSLMSGVPLTMRVRYTPGVMDIFVNGEATPTLSVAVDLAGLLSLDTNGGTTAGQGWVGVTSSTGGLANASQQDLMAFSFTGTPIPAPGAAALVGLGGLMVARRRRAA
jgi:hypothetical protein